ncbi:MAG: DNA polymerase IV [Anaerolineales bacterium]|nr:DNA polymerase IV [Anaerolineales bacterium]
MPRTILHVDLDAFFCSVEELLDPALAGTAFAVGGRADERGVLSTASYAARQFGLHSAMPTAQALRLCPHLNLLPPRHGVYGEHSRRVMAILAEATPLLEQISIDEAFLDVTGDPRPGGEVAAHLKRRIRAEAGLPASFGVAGNKLVAKIATNVGKPDGLVVVPAGAEAAFLAPLPVAMLWGAGPKTRAKLAELGIATIGQVAAWPEADLVRRFGEHGRALARHARGLDDRPVETESQAKSISSETTFARDVTDGDFLRRKFLEMAEEVAASLRRDGLAARTVKIKVRWPPFETLTRQATLPQPTALADEIFAAGWALFQKVWTPGKRVRLIGVGVSGLTEPARQLGLFEEAPQARATRLAQALDAIREKYGQEAVQRAALAKRKPRGKKAD